MSRRANTARPKLRKPKNPYIYILEATIKPPPPSSAPLIPSDTANSTSDIVPPSSDSTTRTTASVPQPASLSKFPLFGKLPYDVRDTFMKIHLLAPSFVQQDGMYVNFSKDIFHFSHRWGLMVLCGINDPHTVKIMDTPEGKLADLRARLNESITEMEEKARYLRMYDSLTPIAIPLLARFRNLREVKLVKEVIHRGGSGRYLANHKPLEWQLKRLWREDDRRHGSGHVRTKIPEFDHVLPFWGPAWEF
ncbi:hypothetical protein DL98DRAFT_590658 [Cadophora sp. DSE1049]|nr:hypothetical protein DL98DRAFT_590658 [Cadophora sp. DSE1049]